jgi:hypothetical protein
MAQRPAEVLPGQPADAGPMGPAARPEEPIPPLTKNLLIPTRGIVVLEDRTLLAWASDGRIQAGSPEEGWGPVIQLPMTYITSAVPDVEGGLLGGSLFPKGEGERAVAVLVDARGAIRSRWDGGKRLFTAVTSATGRRWAVALQELLELLPDGRVLSAGKVPSLSQLLVGPEGQQVLCTPANLSMAQAAPAECRAQGPAEWRVAGPWELAPLVCGQWLVTYEGAALVVRLLANGKQITQRPASVEVLTCGRPGELLAGARQVQGLALPSLETLWKEPCGNSPVVALASNRKIIACLDANGGVERIKGGDSANPE